MVKIRIRKKGYKTWCPDLPNSDKPTQSDWLNTIFSNQNWVFNEDSVIIGHSTGATLILRILEKLPDTCQINKAILVAGVINMGTKKEFYPYKRSLVQDPFNWPKIKKAAKEFYFLGSNNDPYQCGSDQAITMHQNLGGELIIKPKEGHFNLEAGEKYKQFPLILDILER